MAVHYFIETNNNETNLSYLMKTNSYFFYAIYNEFKRRLFSSSKKKYFIECGNGRISEVTHLSANQNHSSYIYGRKLSLDKIMGGPCQWFMQHFKYNKDSSWDWWDETTKELFFMYEIRQIWEEEWE